jgi:hypothetical protein
MNNKTGLGATGCQCMGRTDVACINLQGEHTEVQEYTSGSIKNGISSSAEQLSSFKETKSLH